MAEQYLLNERDAGKFLGVSMRTMQYWRTIGRGPQWTRIRYERGDLMRFIEEGRNTFPDAGGTR